MKRRFYIVLTGVTLVLAFSGCTGGQSSEAANDSSLTELIKDIPTVQYFTDEEVNDEDIKSILEAGINAPSGMNGQPWHFSVITDKNILNEIAEDMSSGMPEEAKAVAQSGGLQKAGIADAPVAIVISLKEDSEFDGGLACENMCVMANALGYGTKIIASPTIAFNGDKKAEYKEMLGIPDDMEASDVILIGKENKDIDTSADGYTGATERNDFDSVVTYVEK